MNASMTSLPAIIGDRRLRYRRCAADRGICVRARRCMSADLDTSIRTQQPDHGDAFVHADSHALIGNSHHGVAAMAAPGLQDQPIIASEYSPTIFSPHDVLQ